MHSKTWIGRVNKSDLPADWKNAQSQHFGVDVVDFVCRVRKMEEKINNFGWETKGEKARGKDINKLRKVAN